MWTSTSMTVPESLILSVMGICVVMGTLVALALVVMAFSKIMESRNSTAASRAVARPEPEPPGISEETAAMIIAAICEELKAAPEELNVTSIVELK